MSERSERIGRLGNAADERSEEKVLERSERIGRLRDAADERSEEKA